MLKSVYNTANLDLMIEELAADAVSLPWSGPPSPSLGAQEGMAAPHNLTRTFKGCDHNIFRHKQSTNLVSHQHLLLPNSHPWYGCFLLWGLAGTMSLQVIFKYCI